MAHVKPLPSERPLALSVDLTSHLRRKQKYTMCLLVVPFLWERASEHMQCLRECFALDDFLTLVGLCFQREGSAHCE